MWRLFLSRNIETPRPRRHQAACERVFESGEHGVTGVREVVRVTMDAVWEELLSGTGSADEFEPAIVNHVVSQRLSAHSSGWNGKLFFQLQEAKLLAQRRRYGGRCVLFGFLTEIYLCDFCSCQEILRRNGRG
jgi:hypothetical protein